MTFKPSPELKESLAELLESFGHIKTDTVPPAEPSVSPLAKEALANLLQSLELPLQSARLSAWNFNPWEVVKLGRDEVRNSHVLAWLVNPMGSHGYGAALLRSLLIHLKEKNQIFPLLSEGYCHVRTEKNPNGEQSERVDIEVDAASFYLLIEVKIGAPEGVEQLNRYAAIAKTVAGQRPWAIIYLTPKKKEATTGGCYSERIVNMSWKEIARMIEKIIAQTSKLQTKSWLAVNHATASFAKHIYNH